MISKIKGLKAKRHPDTEINNMLVFTGPKESLDLLKKKLTITNKSVSYRINMVKKSIAKWSGRSDSWAVEKVAKDKAELAELKESVITEYWDEYSDGSVIAPAGYWFFAEMEDDSHLNKTIKACDFNALCRKKGEYEQRPYQNEALEELLKYKRATTVLATGLGKTRVIIALAMSAIAVGKRTIIVVPTKDLVDQFVESVSKFHDSVTGAHSDRIPKLGTDIMVCSAGTATKHVDKFDVIAIDESHHSPANTWANMLGDCQHAEFVYNFTATPFRSDGLDLAIYAFGGPPVFVRDLVWGIKNKFLMNFDVVVIEVWAWERGEQVIVSRNSLATTAYKKIVTNNRFIEVLQSLLMKAVAKDRKIIAFFKTLKPAEALAKKCKKTIGFSVANAKFKKPLKDFQNGITDVLAATSKLVGEGIDIPDANTAILCTQNSSEAMTFQMLGRVLRLGDKKPLVIDVIAKGYAPFESAARKRHEIWLKAADSITEVKV